MDKNPIIDIIRAVPRPAISVIFAAVIAQAVIEGISLPQWFIGLASTCILWWFGQKTVERIKEKKGV